jgi:hypothetical protein
MCAGVLGCVVQGMWSVLAYLPCHAMCSRYEHKDQSYELGTRTKAISYEHKDQSYEHKDQGSIPKAPSQGVYVRIVLGYMYGAINWG